MGSIVRIEITRADREPVSQPGTVRTVDKYPFDVELIDLSVTGVLLSCDAPLAIGTTITIGIPGIGMHAARVARVDGEQMACAFFPVLDPDDVRKAGAAITLLRADFDKLPVPHEHVAPVIEAAEPAPPAPNHRFKTLVARLRRSG